MLPSSDDAAWSLRCRLAFERYSETLLRSIAARSIRSRTRPPREELLEKLVAALTNPPVIDRRIRGLSQPARRLLAVVGLSRQPRWRVGHLIAILSALGHDDGVKPVEEAFAAGLIHPDVEPTGGAVNDFTEWLGAAGALRSAVFAHPAVANRALGEDLGLPDLSSGQAAAAPPGLADGLDWPLRLAAIWQSIHAAPVRMTQANTLFKKDLTRLQTDEVLTGSAAGDAADVPDLGVLALEMAARAGLLLERNGELSAESFPSSWDAELPAVLAELFAALPLIEHWDPLAGYLPNGDAPTAAPTTGLLSLLILAGCKPAAWVESAAVADWLWTHHPTWAGTIAQEHASGRGTQWIQNWFRGVAQPMNLVELSGEYVRLSGFGRHVLGRAAPPPPPPALPQTLLVQPNAQIIAYRQGLTPGLIAALTRFARWKHLGPACTLELTAEQTYQGLESGLTVPMMLQTLTRHSARPVPAAVADLLQRWSSKRERITIFASAVLVEFATPAELDLALARGIVAIRLTDRIGMTADGAEPELAQLRLLANRDYEARPQRCVSVAEDGVTLSIDAAAADLLLDAEIGRFAAQVNADPSSSRRFRLDADLLRRSTELYSLGDIDTWFADRTGRPLSPAGRLLLLGPRQHAPVADRLLVVRLPSAEFADGLMQWPPTRQLVAERLGPAAIVVAEDRLDELRRVLGEVGVHLESK